MDNMPNPETLTYLDNYWYYGPTGTGKSKGAREAYPNYYNKPKNKWWDGYQGEDTIIIDDLGLDDAKWIGSFLKVWADHYPFVAECKGRSRCIRPTRFIVTSNYAINEIFTDQVGELEPLMRRFKQVHFIGYDTVSRFLI